MRGEDDGVGSLEDRKTIRSGGSSRVRDRRQSPDDANRFCVFSEASGRILFHESDRAHPPDVAQDPHHFVLVLGDFVLDAAHAGFRDCEFGEFADIFVVVDGPADGDAYFIDALLAPCGGDFLGCVGTGDHFSNKAGGSAAAGWRGC